MYWVNKMFYCYCTCLHVLCLCSYMWFEWNKELKKKIWSQYIIHTVFAESFTQNLLHCCYTWLCQLQVIFILDVPSAGMLATREMQATHHKLVMWAGCPEGSGACGCVCLDLGRLLVATCSIFTNKVSCIQHTNTVRAGILIKTHPGCMVVFWWLSFQL